VSYLDHIITHQTPQERDAYEATCKRMAGCVSRPALAQEARFTTAWSELTRDDDWWHCRRLVQMLATRHPQAEYQALEQRLMMVLAATESGSTEALMWLAALEGLLRELSSQVRADGGHDATRDELLEELSLFARGVALNNLALRCPARRVNVNKTSVNTPWNVQIWYAILLRLNLRCASPGCTRPLPHPSSLTRESSSAFSVGTQQARIGTRRARSFISENRAEGYACLVNWILTREPHPALVAAFLWYGELFHVDVWCKAGRGKWAENF
jgi:hypothetical protein